MQSKSELMLRWSSHLAAYAAWERAVQDAETQASAPLSLLWHLGAFNSSDDHTAHVAYPGNALRKGVHAEMRLFWHLSAAVRAQFSDPSGRIVQLRAALKSTVPYIGISKLCCAHCHAFFKAATLCHAGGHCIAFPWPLDAAMVTDRALMRLILGTDSDDLWLQWEALRPATVSMVAQLAAALPDKLDTPIAQLLIEHAPLIVDSSNPQHAVAIGWPNGHPALLNPKRNTQEVPLWK